MIHLGKYLHVFMVVRINCVLVVIISVYRVLRIVDIYI